MNLEQTFNHVHFIGIGGIGMSAVAEVMLERGYTISGSDLNESDQVQMLRGRGATIYVPQRAENITDDIDLVVRSTAIQENNVEYKAALEKGIPVVHRSEMLGYLMQSQKAICVAGSHGKTTTSSMIALCLAWIQRLSLVVSLVILAAVQKMEKANGLLPKPMKAMVVLSIYCHGMR